MILAPMGDRVSNSHTEIVAELIELEWAWTLAGSESLLFGLHVSLFCGGY
jgi:hypothetical protein